MYSMYAFIVSDWGIPKFLFLKPCQVKSQTNVLPAPLSFKVPSHLWQVWRWTQKLQSLLTEPLGDHTFRVFKVILEATTFVKTCFKTYENIILMYKSSRYISNQICIYSIFICWRFNLLSPALCTSFSAKDRPLPWKQTHILLLPRDARLSSFAKHVLIHSDGITWHHLFSFFCCRTCPCHWDLHFASCKFMHTYLKRELNAR